MMKKLSVMLTVILGVALVVVVSPSAKAYDVPSGLRCLEQYPIDLEDQSYLGYREIDCAGQDAQTWFDNESALSSNPTQLGPNDCMYFNVSRKVKKYESCQKADEDLQKTAEKLGANPNAQEIETTNNAQEMNREGENGNGFIEEECRADNNYQDCGLMNTVYSVINFLSAGVGIIIVLSVILGGIQYLTAGNNPQLVSKAKGRIFNAIIALVIYFVFFGFLQWLVPGGLF